MRLGSMARGGHAGRLVRVALTVAVAASLGLAAPVGAARPDGAGKPGGGGGSGGGKPGYPDRIEWSGATWQVKTSNSAVGPGPCVFAKDNVSVDAQGRLRLVIRQLAGRWTCAEIVGPVTHGYGTYTFTLGSDVSALDPNVVLGLFTWSDKAQQAHREIDIEFARWGSATDPTNAQYVVQPWDRAGHLHRFAQPSVARSAHAFTWRRGSLAWASTRLDTGAPIAAYAYAASDVPATGDERVRLNLWLFGGNAPVSGQPVEVIVESFAFVP